MVVILNALKPWLNLQLFKAEQDAKKNPLTPSSTYVDELRKRGVSDEELKDVVQMKDALQREVKASGKRLAFAEVEIDDDEGDPIVSLTPQHD